MHQNLGLVLKLTMQALLICCVESFKNANQSNRVIPSEAIKVYNVFGDHLEKMKTKQKTNAIYLHLN